MVDMNPLVYPNRRGLVIGKCGGGALTSKKAIIVSLWTLFVCFSQPVFAQSQVVELFISAQCAPNEVAKDILGKLRAGQNSSGVLTLVCDLANKSCKNRRSLYTRRKVLRRYSTPSSVFNGRYDVLAYDERVMRSALAMVRSTMSLPRIVVSAGADGLALEFPDMSEGAVYAPWVAVYDGQTTQVKKFEELGSVQARASVCVHAPVSFEAGERYAVFLHDDDGEIVATGHYSKD